MMTPEEIAEPNTILQVQVGSQLYGVALDNSDCDVMGICVEPPEYVLGLGQFAQYVYRDAPEGVRSQPGDLELTIYGLKKWTSLALKGNLHGLQLLYAPESMCTILHPLAIELREHADWFASRAAGKSFLGFATQQRQRLTGERGQKSVKRPELEAAHGYDTKYAGHVIRLYLQGIEFLSSGRLKLPMPTWAREEVLAVRRGEFSYTAVTRRAEALERKLEYILHNSCTLPDLPDRTAVSAWLETAYPRFWEERRATSCN